MRSNVALKLTRALSVARCARNYETPLQLSVGVREQRSARSVELPCGGVNSGRCANALAELATGSCECHALGRLGGGRLAGLPPDPSGTAARCLRLRRRELARPCARRTVGRARACSAGRSGRVEARAEVSEPRLLPNVALKLSGPYFGSALRAPL